MPYPPLRALSPPLLTPHLTSPPHTHALGHSPARRTPTLRPVVGASRRFFGGGEGGRPPPGRVPEPQVIRLGLHEQKSKKRGFERRAQKVYLFINFSSRHNEHFRGQRSLGEVESRSLPKGKIKGSNPLEIGFFLIFAHETGRRISRAIHWCKTQIKRSSTRPVRVDQSRRARSGRI